MIGEGSKCALPKQEQCQWARKCVSEKDCSSPPLGEMLMQMSEFKEQHKGQNPLQKLMEQPSIIFPPGTWVSHCPVCNMALNTAYWLDNDKPMITEIPIL